MPDRILLVVEVLSALFYFAATIVFVKKKDSVFSNIIWGTAVGLNGVIVLNNWFINGYVPFVSMYQVLTFLALVFAPIYLMVKYRYNGGWMKGCFSGTAAVCMFGVCFMSGKGAWAFPPALQSIWFVPHILCYMISYSLTTVSCILTVYSFFVNSAKRSIVDKGVYDLLVTGFPFMTMGMLFGAIWANAVWGEFWSFDAKENWSLVTWLMSCIYLHFRKDAKLKRYSKVFVILSFISVIVTMLFVNFMGGNSQHTYSV